MPDAVLLGELVIREPPRVCVGQVLAGGCINTFRLGDFYTTTL